ncbi:MAG: ABC transporter permease [Candidatus Thorarchaeota archaeon]
MGLTVSLLMVLVGIGMITGSLDESKRIVEKSEYDAFIIQYNRDNIMEGGRVPDYVYDKVVSLRGVKDIDKIIDDWISVRFGDEDTSVAMIGYDIETDYLEPWDIIEGDKDDLKNNNVVLVDQLIKKYFPDVNIDDKLKASEPEVSLKITGMTQNNQRFGNAMMWVNFETAKGLLHIDNESTYLCVKFKSGYSVDDLKDDLEIFDDVIKVISSEEMEKLIEDYLLIEYGIAQSVGILAVMGFIVAMIVISITLYQSVIDKLRELVSLKALGAKKSFINKILIGQTFLIVTVSFVLATLLALLLAPYLSAQSALAVNVNWLWALSVYVITLILGTLCSLIPIRKVHKTDPAIIFRA